MGSHSIINGDATDFVESVVDVFIDGYSGSVIAFFQVAIFLQ